MADPKYVGLPGIVYDQPDVFETSDLPESEQDLDYADQEESSSSVEVLHISASGAHEKFKGKILDSSMVDFSDRISRRSQKGYASRNIEWEIGGEDETVVQKYQRLQCEITNLQQEAQQLKGDLDHCNGKISAEELNEQVRNLQSILLNINLEETLGKNLLDTVAQPEKALQERLVTLFENFKNSGATSSQSAVPNKDEIGESSNNVKYELCYAPEHTKLNQLARASQLEKRLDKLETLIGNNHEKMSSLSTWTNHKSLMGASQVLSSRLSLLEPAHLDHIEGRLHAVHTKMNALAENRTISDDADKQAKVAELYEMMKKCEKLSSDFPEVIARLVFVENLNQEAAQFGRSLKQLDAAETQLNSTLESNATLMKAVREKFMDSLNAIQKNISSLDDRIQKLPKK